MIKLHPSAKYLLIPVGYWLLAKNLNKYYLKNELRFLYKQDILVPWLRRIDDHQCSDHRDVRLELERSSKVDEEKSVIHRQLLMVENKGQTLIGNPMMAGSSRSSSVPEGSESGTYGQFAAREPSEATETLSPSTRASNMNLIKR